MWLFLLPGWFRWLRAGSETERGAVTEPLSQCGSDTLLPAAPPARGILLQSGRISDHRWAHRSNTSQTEFRKVVYSTPGLLRLSVMLDESLVLGRDLEIQLEVRLVSDSGLLLHTGAKKTQQLSLYLNQGQVTQPCAHTDTRNNLPRTLTRLQMRAGKWFRVSGAAWRSVGRVRTPVWSVFVLCRWLCWWTAAVESSPSVSHQKSLSVMEVGTLLQVSR